MKLLQQIRKIRLKAILVIVSAFLTLGLGVGGTVAYLTDRTDVANNVFTPAKLETQVIYSGSSATVRNTGEIEAYLRVVVVVHWAKLDENGHATSNVHASSPKEGVDYALSLASAQEWVRGSDGYWYCKAPVAAGTDAPLLIESVSRLTEAPDGYGLMVGLISSAIQSQPAEVVENSWGVTVNADGTVTPR